MSLNVRMRSWRRSVKLLKPASSSRLRFCSAPLATVFEGDFEDSRMRLPANQNSYHQTSPRRKRLMRMAPIFFPQRKIQTTMRAESCAHRETFFAGWLRRLLRWEGNRTVRTILLYQDKHR